MGCRKLCSRCVEYGGLPCGTLGQRPSSSSHGHWCFLPALRHCSGCLLQLVHHLRTQDKRCSADAMADSVECSYRWSASPSWFSERWWDQGLVPENAGSNHSPWFSPHPLPWHLYVPRQIYWYSLCYIIDSGETNISDTLDLVLVLLLVCPHGDWYLGSKCN